MLIDFWASWCGLCKKEIPNLKKIYEEYRDKGFAIVSISIDKSPEAWKKVIGEFQLPWANFRDSNVTPFYKVTSVPTTCLLDGQGKLVDENLRGDALSQKLGEILSK